METAKGSFVVVSLVGEMQGDKFHSILQARSSAEEHFPDTEGVSSSILLVPMFQVRGRGDGHKCGPLLPHHKYE